MLWRALRRARQAFHDMPLETFCYWALVSLIPHGQRSGFPQSHYTARLTALPTAGSAIQVVFHGAHRDDCELARKS